MKKWAFILLLFTCTLGCVGNAIYEKFEPINKEGWNAKDMKTFNFEVVDLQPFSVCVALRNTTDYTKANLWLFVTTVSPSGYVAKDTLDCPLADDYGYWLGSGFSGLYETKHLLFLNEKPEQGKWTVTVQQAMRSDNVIGIKELGLIVEPIIEE